MDFMVSARCGVLLIASTFALSCGMCSSARADTVVITAGKMVDVLAGRVLEHPQVTVTDGRITAVGAAGGDVPAGARRVDCPFQIS